MKKLNVFLLTATIVLSACATPEPIVPTNTSTPAFTKTPLPTQIPTQTPTPIPLPKDPYAQISASKAEFWFPLPDQEEYEWSILENPSSDFGWFVVFGDLDDYAQLGVSCGYPKAETFQIGTIENMLKTCRKSLYTHDSPKENIATDDTFSVSVVDKGILINLTDSDLINILIEKKPQSVLFKIAQSSRITPSTTSLDFTNSSAFIQPDKVEFWFQIPEEEWSWNLPLEYIGKSPGTSSVSTQWGVSVNNYRIAVACWTRWEDKDKPIQTGSFDEFIQTCQDLSYHFDSAGKVVLLQGENPDISFTSMNDGLLIQLTNQELVNYLNENSSQSIVFSTFIPFELTPTYK